MQSTPTTTAAAVTQPNPIQENNNNNSSICGYLMACVMAIVDCVREFFNCICPRDPEIDRMAQQIRAMESASAAAVQTPAQPANLKLLPTNMHFERMVKDNAQLASWLTNTTRNLKLEINYQTSEGTIKKEYSDVDALECRCYCDIVFEDALLNTNPNYKYNIQITITGPANKSLKFNWHNATTIAQPLTFAIPTRQIGPNFNFDGVMRQLPQLRDWFRDGGKVYLKHSWTYQGVRVPKFETLSKPLVTEKFDIDEEGCRTECNKIIETTKSLLSRATHGKPVFTYLQFTFTKSDSPNDSLTCTYQDMYFL